MALRRNKERRRRRTSKIKPRFDEEPGGPNNITLSKRAHALSTYIRIYPDQLAMGLAQQDEAGWSFGRLYLVGAIDMQQYGAAKHLDRVVSRYKREMHRHGLVRTANYEFTIGGSSEDLSDDAIRLSERICRDYLALRRKLENCGEGVREVVFEVLEQDKLTDLVLLRKGLNALI